MLVIHNHESRIKILPLGAATKNERTHEIMQPRMLTLYAGKNVITDPAVCEIIKKLPAFKEAVVAAAAQRQAGTKLKGFDFEEFPDVEEAKPKPKAVKGKAKADEPPADENGEEVVVNIYRHVPSARMKDVIANTTTIKQLQDILAVEDRAPISAAATARIKALRKDLADNTASDDDDE